MTDLDVSPSCNCGDRMVYVADQPIDFTNWLELTHNLDTELIRGVMIPIMAAQYPHEWIFAWLFKIFGTFAENRGLGVVLGSRTAVKISRYDGRIPDILFVRAGNTGIIHDDAIYGVPDLVIEIVSATDRPSDLLPLEADYRSLGVPQIVFINPRKRHVRVLLKNQDGDEGDYNETILTTGELTFAGVPGFYVSVEWLFAENKPDAFTITRQLIEEVEATGSSER